MYKFLAFINGIAFLFLGVLHVYWALGGRWGYTNALPTNEKGAIVLHPRKAHSMLVGFALSVFAGYYLNLAFPVFYLPPQLLNYTGWGIGLLFLLRAIGDFRYVGFFKKIRYTSFGKRDTKYFAPLCFLLSIIAFFLALRS